MRTLTISTPGGAIAVRDSADAAGSASRAGELEGDARPPLVLLHGMITDSKVWDATLARLRGARGRRVVLPELRGHGASTPPGDDDYSVAACADDLQRVLDALGLERILLVGHSYGSLVALEAASREPRRVARLVLADPPGALDALPREVKERELDPYLAALEGPGWREASSAGFEDALGPHASTASRDLIRGAMATAPHALVLSMMRSMFAYDPIRALDRYMGTPGAHAHAILAPSNAWPYSLHVVRPSLPTTTIPEVGHWLQLDAPDAFADALDAALAVG